MNTIDWVRQGIELKKLYDLGKFCFTAGTATLAFLAAAEKVNTVASWEGGLACAAILLLLATILAAAMVIIAAPHTTAVDAASILPTWSVIVWFVLWAVGAAVGLKAVLPNSPPGG